MNLFHPPLPLSRWEVVWNDPPKPVDKSGGASAEKGIPTSAQEGESLGGRGVARKMSGLDAIAPSAGGTSTSTGQQRQNSDDDSGDDAAGAGGISGMRTWTFKHTSINLFTGFPSIFFSLKVIAVPQWITSLA